MHIHVKLDITKPLCRGRKTRLKKGCETWISFKYERLPNFCYWCSHVTHSNKDCPYWLRNKEVLPQEEQQIGPWLRAPNERPWRNLEIKVEGIIRPPPPKLTKPSPSQSSPQTRPPYAKTPPNASTNIPPSRLNLVLKSPTPSLQAATYTPPQHTPAADQCDNHQPFSNPS
jgi:hypothetical protein